MRSLPVRDRDGVVNDEVFASLRDVALFLKARLTKDDLASAIELVTEYGNSVALGCARANAILRIR